MLNLPLHPWENNPRILVDADGGDFADCHTEECAALVLSAVNRLAAAEKLAEAVEALLPYAAETEQQVWSDHGDGTLATSEDERLVQCRQALSAFNATKAQS